MSTIYTIDLTTIRVASIDAVDVSCANDWFTRIHLRGGAELTFSHKSYDEMRELALALRAAMVDPKANPITAEWHLA